MGELGPAQANVERAIFLGASAKRSVISAAMTEADHEAAPHHERDAIPAPETIDGVRVIETDVFPGWAIGERVKHGKQTGRWVDVTTGTPLAA